LLGGRVIGLIWGAVKPAGIDVYPTALVWVGAGAVGVALLGGLALIRYWQRRSGRVRPQLLGSYSPIPGAIVMFFLAAFIVYAWKRSEAPAYGLPDVGVALIAAVCSAACYLVAWGRALRRRPRAVAASA
jgi:peptidoglycan/LPS O-acetylase OafA/YrhL